MKGRSLQSTGTLVAILFDALLWEAPRAWLAIVRPLRFMASTCELQGCWSSSKGVGFTNIGFHSSRVLPAACNFLGIHRV